MFDVESIFKFLLHNRGAHSITTRTTTLAARSSNIFAAALVIKRQLRAAVATTAARTAHAKGMQIARAEHHSVASLEVASSG